MAMSDRIGVEIGHDADGAAERRWSFQFWTQIPAAGWALIALLILMPAFANDFVLYQIFGWSSPYEPETSFEPEWVEEAIGSLHEQACVAQLELLNGTGSQRDRDELYLLPREIRQLAEPLRIWDTHIREIHLVKV